MSALSKIFGSHSERELKRIYPIADKVESYKEAMGKLSDEELKDKTREFKKRLEDGAPCVTTRPGAMPYSARRHRNIQRLQLPTSHTRAHLTQQHNDK